MTIYDIDVKEQFFEHNYFKMCNEVDDDFEDQYILDWGYKYFGDFQGKTFKNRDEFRKWFKERAPISLGHDFSETEDPKKYKKIIKKFIIILGNTISDMPDFDLEED